MRLLALGILGLCSFMGTTLLLLGITGHLGGDTLENLGGATADSSNAAAESTPSGASLDADSLAMALQEKEAQLDNREAALQEREAQLEMREENLKQMRETLERLQESMEQSITADEEMRDLRIATIAVTLSNMRPQEAAERLERLPVEDIGAILLQIERARDRGAILGELEPELATEALEYMQSHDGK